MNDSHIESPPSGERKSCEPKVRILLVHGTFSSEKQFPTTSLMRRKFEELPLVECVPFPWSGKNSPKAREHAATDLRDRITKLSSDSEAIYIVAHSHGGNVAVRAMNQLDEKGATSKVRGIVALGTPFFHARTRSKTLIDIMEMTLIFLLQCSALLCIGMLMQKFETWLLQCVLVPAIIAVFFCSSLLLRKIETRCYEFCKQSFFGVAGSTFSLLCMFDERDEAYWLLRVQAFLMGAVLPLPLISIMAIFIVLPQIPNPGDNIFLPREFFERVTNADGTESAASIEEIQQTFGQFRNAIDDLRQRREDYDALVFRIMLIPVVTSLLVVLAGVFIQGWSAGIGLAPIGTYLYYNVVSSRVPIGKRIVQVLPIDLEKKNLGLWHSRYYDDENAVAETAKWISDEIAKNRL